MTYYYVVTIGTSSAMFGTMASVNTHLARWLHAGCSATIEKRRLGVY